MTRIIWNQVEAVYRGQSSTGAVITVDEDALQRALRNAGNAVFDSEWWLESLPVVLERWSLGSRRWMDQVTGMPRVHYRIVTDPPPQSRTGPFGNTGPLIKGTGPLTTRILNSGKLDSGKLSSPDFESNRLRDLDKE
jgi:hypothetical protein